MALSNSKYYSFSSSEIGKLSVLLKKAEEQADRAELLRLAERTHT
jgi:hypothetical protein